MKLAPLFSSATLLASASRGMVLGLASMVAVAGVAVMGVGCAGAAGAEDGETTAETTEDLSAKPSDGVVRDDILTAAKGLLFMSETDAPYTFVSAPLLAGETVTQASVRRAFASIVDNDPQADKPLSTLVGDSQTFSQWRSRFKSCDPDRAADCAKTEALNTVLAKDLTGVKVFVFGRKGSPGHVDGIGVSIFIVGTAKSGKMTGIRTFAVWT